MYIGNMMSMKIVGKMHRDHSGSVTELLNRTRLVLVQKTLQRRRICVAVLG